MKYPEIISASAGSGKTYTITDRIFKLIKEGKVAPHKIIATTFSNKAANELKSRIRSKLIKEGKTLEANLMNEALIGTINSVCLMLLKKFAFQAGISPQLQTLDANDQKVILREVVGGILDEHFIELAVKLYQSESSDFFSSAIPYISQIEQLISKFKNNNLPTDNFEAYANESIKEFFALHPCVIKSHKKIKAQVLALIKEGLEHSGRTEKKKSKNFKTQRAKLEDTYHNIKNDNFTWHEWISKVSLGKSFLPDNFHENLTELTGNLFSNSQFHEDYAAYVKLCFSYAKEAIASYDKYKRERGLLDFTDQEALLHGLLLDNKVVRKLLADNFQLVVVDEFQDVSPLQLDMFLKLTQLVDRSIWVGDPKQSIYAFRGADPQLMNSVVNTLPEDRKDQLEHSFRSRESLIAYTNVIFTQAFDNTMKTDSIVLTQASNELTGRAEDEESTLAPAVHYWKFKWAGTGRSNKTSLNESLAEQIHILMQAPPQVYDKNKKIYRSAQYGDLAILCRSNKACQAIGHQLSRAGIPVAASGFGLLEEPEVIFMMALIKLLVYPNDSLAKAEVLLYSHYDGSQEAMINDRLAYKDNKSWQSDNDYLTQLALLRKATFNFAPSKCIEQLLAQLQLEELYASWGNLSQRLANVDALILHAKEYQQTCSRLKLASSLAGLINWLKSLNDTEEDTKGVQRGDVVQVMTYHKSKGLEWGLVFLWDLDYDIKDNFFGVKVVNESPMDIENPLSNRRLRLFVKPFSNKSKPASFNEPLSSTAQFQAAIKERDEEEKRLFYVAMTRARDYLYFCSYNSKMKIAEIVSPLIDQNDLEEGFQETCLIWSGKKLKAQIKNIDVIKKYDLDNYGEKTSRVYFPPGLGAQEYASLKLNPSSVVSIHKLKSLALISFTIGIMWIG